LSRRLIVNGDDFGFTPEVNLGILEAHRAGILTSTTLMANGDAFDDAARIALANPTLDVGCHLVLIGGRSLVPPHMALPRSVPALLRALSARRLRVYDELAAQVRKILAAGLHPTHLDTHKHTHLAPPVLDAVARIAEEFEIGWVRRPFDVPALGWLFRRVLVRHGCRTTDHFTGFRLTGRFLAADVVRMIHGLPEGLTEFMCHPGYCGEALRRADTRLKESRERELAALTATETRQALLDCGVELTDYRRAMLYT